MKTTLTPFLAFFALSAAAQPTLQYANVNLIGKTFPVHLVTDPGSADPLTDGAGIIWDFSSITLQMNVGSVTFVDPAGTPYASSYPTANLAQVVTSIEGTSYDYFALEATQLDMLAEGVGSTDPRVYTGPKTPLQFPLAYQGFFVDNYTEGGSSSTVTRAYSAYGTVILPTGTFTNVVKVTSSSGNIDFYHSDPLEPLGHIESDGAVIVYGDATVGIADLGQMPALGAMPNPTADQVQVTGLGSGAHWQLMDLQGRVLRSGVHRSGPLQLHLADLAGGPYALVAVDGTGRHALQVVKQ